MCASSPRNRYSPHNHNIGGHALRQRCSGAYIARATLKLETTPPLTLNPTPNTLNHTPNTLSPDPRPRTLNPAPESSKKTTTCSTTPETPHTSGRTTPVSGPPRPRSPPYPRTRGAVSYERCTPVQCKLVNFGAENHPGTPNWLFFLLTLTPRAG